MSIISGEFVREKQFSCNLLRLNAFYMQIVVSRLDVAECGRMRQRDAATGCGAFCDQRESPIYDF